MKTYQRIAQLLDARQHCKESKNTEWFDKHTDSIEEIVKNNLPSGSGLDAGVVLDFETSNPEKIVLLTSYHHMNENGFYNGWSDHKVIVTPSLAFGMNIKITGENRNDIKDFLFDVFEHDLNYDLTSKLD
jgi:hypothetical protein